jgi:hypothetical protein
MKIKHWQFVLAWFAAPVTCILSNPDSLVN